MGSYGVAGSYKPTHNWCLVCDGFGGWDKQSNRPRWRESGDTKDTYMPCLWCGLGNVVRKVT